VRGARLVISAARDAQLGAVELLAGERERVAALYLVRARARARVRARVRDRVRVKDRVRGRVRVAALYRRAELDEGCVLLRQRVHLEHGVARSHN
jgi:hypothetical protein